MRHLFINACLCALIAALSLPAFAETTGKPMQTGDELPFDTELEELAPHVPENTPVVGRDLPITVSGNEDISIDGFGLLDEHNGGMEEEVWKDSTRAGVDPLLAVINGGISVPVLRELLVTLLTTTATAPEGDKPVPDFLQRRLDTLVAIGRDGKALEMVNSLPATMVSEGAARAANEITLLRGNYDGACANAASQVEKYESEYFQKLMVLCHTRAGKVSEAQLILDLMAEQNREPNKFFKDIMAALASKTPKTVEAVPSDLGLFEVGALFAAGQKKLPVEYLKTAPLAVMKVIADGEFSAETRAAAAERAVLYGALPLISLTKAYGAFGFTQKELAASVEAIAKMPGVKAGALLYEKQKKETVPAKRWQIIMKAHDHYAASRLRPLWLALYADDLAALVAAVPKEEQVSDGVDALILAGKNAEAASLMAAATGLGVADKFIYTTLLGINSKTAGENKQITPPADIKVLTEREQRRLYRLYGMLEALGYTVDSSVYNEDFKRVSTQVDMVSPRALKQLDEALAADRKGEALLLAVIIAGGGDIGRVDDGALQKVVRGLVSIAHEKEAVALAVASVLAVR